jgi:hypothetical protein
MPLENIRVALAGAEFHSEQICTGRAALMRPFLIPALGAELGAWIKGSRAGLIMALIAGHRRGWNRALRFLGAYSAMPIRPRPHAARPWLRLFNDGAQADHDDGKSSN